MAHHSPFREDLARYRKACRNPWLEPSLWSVAMYRSGQWCRRRRFGWVARLLAAMHLPMYSIVMLVTGIQLPRGARIGEGLLIWHFGCLFIHSDAAIGRRCTLRHGVTIGTRRGDHDVPVLGDDVEVGAGAKILGSIRIGSRVTIGANAVVLDDVPDDHVAVGIPARIFPRKQCAEDAEFCQTASCGELV